MNEPAFGTWKLAAAELRRSGSPRRVCHWAWYGRIGSKPERLFNLPSFRATRQVAAASAAKVFGLWGLLEYCELQGAPSGVARKLR